MNICPICSPVVNISIPYTSERCRYHMGPAFNLPSYQGPGVINPNPAPATVIPKLLLQVDEAMTNESTDAFIKISNQVISSIRKMIAEYTTRIASVQRRGDSRLGLDMTTLFIK